MGALEKLLPESALQAAAKAGNELVLPRAHALEALEIAEQNQIAVLGVEYFRIQPDGFMVLDYSGYDGEFPPGSDWKEYVHSMNEQALLWITCHEPQDNHGYILTSTSMNEFVGLRPPA